MESRPAEDPGLDALGGPGRNGPQDPNALAPPATAEAGGAPDATGPTTEVLVRDLLIFQLKLFLDGIKDIVLSPLSVLAVLWDLVPSRRSRKGEAFYRVLKLGERYDLWLNLYNPAREARARGEGLLEAGAHSADSLVGKLEQLAREEARRQGWTGKKGREG